MTTHLHNNQSLRTTLARRFSLLSDKADDNEIERRIRDGVELSGATPWILMFAIFIASVGLNVNSTAVIIGAMLISPLMGPIMGAGLGVAIYDFDLVKRSLLNLAIATIISLVVSTIYFSISPLQQAQSELLARTTPTIWDVLIAIFGGLAGIIGITRQEKSNVIPGVAIATALMPPVCTAGFGLATQQWGFVIGALYLYTINCVFISLATIIGIRILKLKQHGFADERIAKRIKLTLAVLALSTALPSAYLAIQLVKEEVFNTRARQFINREFEFKNTHVADFKINPQLKKIEVSLIGSPISSVDIKNIEGRLSATQLDGAQIKIHQSGYNKVDVTALKTSLLSDLYRESQEALSKKDEEIVHLKGELQKRDSLTLMANDISLELRAHHPSIEQIIISEGVAFDTKMPAQKILHLSVQTQSAFSTEIQERIKDWFRTRTKADIVMVSFTPNKEIHKH